MSTSKPAASSASSATYTPYPSDAPTLRLSGRVAAIDVLRGIVVVLMAIDHVRVFSGLPAGGPSPGIFLTRWITHFVAPVFVFLAGTAAFLHGRKLGDTRQLAKFLVTRGLLLVLLELSVIRLSWTFNLDYGTYLLAGVIWVIGWSMVALGALVFLPPKAVGAFGLVVIFGHNLLPTLLGPLQPAIESSGMAWLFQLLYFGGPIQLGGGPSLVVLYSFIPWVGVLAAGYGFGLIYEMEPARRRRVLLQVGGAAVVLFVLLRGFNLYGEPQPWRGGDAGGAWPVLRSFLNTSKYPASLLFLLMTLGPALLLLPILERAKNRVTDALEVFGRVPMFYYLLHIPLIHALACVVSLARTGSVTPWLFGNHPMWPPEQPPGYTWSLGLLYAVTAVAVVLLYFACRWYARVKATSPRPWMKYL